LRGYDVSVTGLGAAQRERLKDIAYEDAMERRRREARSGLRGARAFPEGWNDDVFVPLGFEGDGAWGPRAQWAFDQGVAAKAEVEKDKEGDFNEMSFGEYWRARMAAILVCGQAKVAGSNSQPFDDGLEATEASTEHHSDRGA
jgi:hypothetical protein